MGMPKLGVGVCALVMLTSATIAFSGPAVAVAVGCAEESSKECEWPEKTKAKPTEGEWPKEKGSPKKEEEAGRDPILFVHGYGGDLTTFQTMEKNFLANGWPASRLHNWAYVSAESNVATAEQISTIVNHLLEVTSASKVDIITHSMGALSSRYYIKFLKGDTKVDDWVSLGGPNHGTTSANSIFCQTTACVEMRPSSTFLNNLNGGDETPGEVNYLTWRTITGCDYVISPAESVELVGATNIIIEGCVSHINLHESSSIFIEVHEWVLN